ncbi:MAG: DNA primase [Bacteroidetes bacterium]|nr:DNA primase [Bacteroidota bacterium]
MISPGSIEQLLNAVVIEDVVGDYVSLKRSGSRYKGLCPFHDEKTPSFIVSPGMGIYKCFGCQKGGNAIQFLMEIDNMSYPEAAKALAARYGIELIETGNRDDDEYREKQKVRESLQAALDYAAGFFENQLHDEVEGKTKAMPYFKERGYTYETIRKWRLGYSPEDWEAFTLKATKQGYKSENLELAGLIKKRDNGSFYDLYRNRVIFPLVGVSGKLLGFAGRKMSSTDPAPKYVNSPETELYKKSDFLYGIFQAKNAIKKQDKVYLTEGYTDVITLHQAGIENVVASSGTALTPSQIKLIRRFTPNVTVLYDGDAAGIKASLRGIDLLLADDLNVRVVSLPEGKDPDSYCSKLGGEAFSDYLYSEEQNFILFKAKLLLSECGDDPIKKSEAIRDILQSVACMNDALKRNAMSQELARVCKIDEALLAAELGKLLRSKNLKNEQDFIKEVKQLTTASGIEFPREELTDVHQERALFRILLLHGDETWDENSKVSDFIIKEIKEDNQLLFNDEMCALLVAQIKFGVWDKWPGQSYFTQHSNADIASWAAGVLSSGYELSSAFADNFIHVKKEEDNFKNEITAVFLYLRKKKLDNLIKHYTLLLQDPETDVSDTLEMLNYLNELRSRVSKDIGGVVFTI